MKESLEDRRKFCMSKGLCFGCLEHGHLNKQCENRKRCRACFKSHPTAFHDFYKSSSLETKPKEKTDETSEDFVEHLDEEATPRVVHSSHGQTVEERE